MLAPFAISMFIGIVIGMVAAFRMFDARHGTLQQWIEYADSLESVLAYNQIKIEDYRLDAMIARAESVPVNNGKPRNQQKRSERVSAVVLPGFEFADNIKDKELVFSDHPEDKGVLVFQDKPAKDGQKKSQKTQSKAKSKKSQDQQKKSQQNGGKRDSGDKIMKTRVLRNHKTVDSKGNERKINKDDWSYVTNKIDSWRNVPDDDDQLIKQVSQLLKNKQYTLVAD